MAQRQLDTKIGKVLEATEFAKGDALKKGSMGTLVKCDTAGEFGVGFANAGTTDGDTTPVQYTPISARTTAEGVAGADITVSASVFKVTTDTDGKMIPYVAGSHDYSWGSVSKSVTDGQRVQVELEMERT